LVPLKNEIGCGVAKIEGAPLEMETATGADPGLNASGTSGESVREFSAYAVIWNRAGILTLALDGGESNMNPEGSSVTVKDWD
jgi:hypothetical protein